MIHMRIGIDIVQPHPSIELAQLAGEVGHVRTHFSAGLQRIGGVAHVDAIGRGVLANDQQFLGAGGDQLLGLAQDCIGPAAGEIAAQARDDAEGAAVIAALRNLQIAVVARRELQITLRHQIEEGRRRNRRRVVDRAHHLLILMRTGDGEHVGEALADHLRFLAHAAGDDDAAILRDRLTDGFEALLLGGIEETAGVDEHDVGTGIVGGHGIAIRAELGQDAFAVHKVLRTAERNHADLGRGGEYRCHESAAHIMQCAPIY